MLYYCITLLVCIYTLPLISLEPIQEDLLVVSRDHGDNHDDKIPNRYDLMHDKEMDREIEEMTSYMRDNAPYHGQSQKL